LGACLSPRNEAQRIEDFFLESGKERRFFISDGRPLYSVMQRGVSRDAPVVLFCHGFAQDLAFNWRAQVLAANILAERGYSTFSYHARAHGDSAGSFEELTFAGLVDDAVAAASHAIVATGASHIVWVGVRFGALVAAAAMRHRSNAAAFVMWEPAHSGSAYLRSLLRRVLFFQVSRGRRPELTVEQMVERLEHGHTVPLLGTELHPAFYRSALEADLRRDLDSWQGPTLLAQIQQRPRLSQEHKDLESDLAPRVASLKTLLVSEEPNWDNGFEAWWTLEGLSGQMGDWLDGLD
jgi:alpha/beta superfamily hydrolase